MSRIIERVRQALGVTANDGRDKLVFAKSADFCACASAPIAAEEQAGWMDRIREEAKALNLQVHESADLAACGATPCPILVLMPAGPRASSAVVTRVGFTSELPEP